MNINKETMKKKRVSLSISKETKGMLNPIKHTGQSYNGLIQELVTLWGKEHGVEGTAHAPSAVERGQGDCEK